MGRVNVRIYLRQPTRELPLLPPHPHAPAPPPSPSRCPSLFPSSLLVRPLLLPAAVPQPPGDQCAVDTSVRICMRDNCSFSSRFSPKANGRALLASQQSWSCNGAEFPRHRRRPVCANSVAMVGLEVQRWKSTDPAGTGDCMLRVGGFWVWEQNIPLFWQAPAANMLVRC